MKMSTVVIVMAIFTILPRTSVAQKSALDHVQFDGVSSDDELKIEHHTRRHWLDVHPVQAKEYWNAWDCKDIPCDSVWKANIRKKAALIKRTVKDPPPSAKPNHKAAG